MRRRLACHAARWLAVAKVSPTVPLGLLGLHTLDLLNRVAAATQRGDPTYRVGRRLAGQYVVETLYALRGEIVVELEGRVVKRFPSLIREKLVPRYGSPMNARSLHDVMAARG